MTEIVTVLGPSSSKLELQDVNFYIIIKKNSNIVLGKYKLNNHSVLEMEYFHLGILWDHHFTAHITSYLQKPAQNL